MSSLSNLNATHQSPTKSILNYRTISRSGLSRFGGFCLLAGLVTGTNWYVQSKLAQAQEERQKEIIRRVSEGKTIDINELEDLTNINNIEGAKVTVTGELQPGRFIVKRNRGDQEGYLVLAPFIVEREKRYGRFEQQQSENTKFMLNIGWVPKESKHRIKEIAAIDALNFDELPEELANDYDAPAKSTITAFVRKGEERDILRGYNNWDQDRLYKFIDLPLLEAVFNSTRPAFRHVYLDRVEETEQEESFPFPNTSDNYISQLNEEIAQANKHKSTYTQGVGLLSFASAALISLL